MLFLGVVRSWKRRLDEKGEKEFEMSSVFLFVVRIFQSLFSEMKLNEKIYQVPREKGKRGYSEGNSEAEDLKESEKGRERKRKGLEKKRSQAESACTFTQLCQTR